MKGEEEIQHRCNEERDVVTTKVLDVFIIQPCWYHSGRLGNSMCMNGSIHSPKDFGIRDGLSPRNL